MEPGQVAGGALEAVLVLVFDEVERRDVADHGADHREDANDRSQPPENHFARSSDHVIPPFNWARHAHSPKSIARTGTLIGHHLLPTRRNFKSRQNPASTRALKERRRHATAVSARASTGNNFLRT